MEAFIFDQNCTDDIIFYNYGKKFFTGSLLQGNGVPLILNLDHSDKAPLDQTLIKILIWRLIINI